MPDRLAGNDRGEAGRQYQVIYTGDFGTWFALGDPIEVTEPSDAQITDPDPPDDRRFYALEVRLR